MAFSPRSTKVVGHDSHAAVPLVLNGAGGHDAGHPAAGADEHGDEALAAKAELTENPVHDEGHPGHVANVLQNGKHQKQHQHLGHKAQHSAHTGHNAVGDQARQPIGSAPARKQRAGALSSSAAQHVVGPVGQEGAEGAHGNPVDNHHHHGENGQGQHPVGDDFVDLIRGGQAVEGGLFSSRPSPPPCLM